MGYVKEALVKFLRSYLMHRKSCLVALYIMFIIMVQASQLNAASYVVLPFKVNAPPSYTYLEKAIPSMLTSRLSWEEHFQPISDADIIKAGKLADINEMDKVRIATGADYLIWGQVNIVGDEATLDVQVCNVEGSIWRKSKNTKVDNLITALQDTADAINSELFGRVVTKASSQNTIVAQMNSGLIKGKGNENQSYLNPEFRYQGSDLSRGRSQSLPFASVGIVVGDFMGDNKNEVAILSEYKIHIYRWEEERLALLGEYKFPRSLQSLHIRAFDVDHDGVQEIIVSCFDSSYAKPYSFILSFKNGVFKELATNLPFYLNVVKLPPDFSPTLIGQSSDNSRIFSPSGIYEIEKHGHNYVMGSRLSLPKEANIFNFSWLPSDSLKDEEAKLVLISNNERLVVYNKKGTRLFMTEEVYYGSSVGIDEPSNMPGLGKSKELIPSKYFIPGRMIPINFNSMGKWELLVSKPISVAAKFFENYRSFAEGEIQALEWDGLGLGLVWNTRRIKGTITDFAIADMNNDGKLDLVVSVNSHTGILGLEKRKTIIVFYPLEVDKQGILNAVEDN